MIDSTVESIQPERIIMSSNVILARLITAQTNVAQHKIDTDAMINLNSIMFGDLCKLIFDATPSKGAKITVKMISQEFKALVDAHPEYAGEVLVAESTLNAARRVGRILGADGDLPSGVTARALQSLIVKVSKSDGMASVDKIITAAWKSGKSGIVEALRKSVTTAAAARKADKEEADRQEQEARQNNSTDLGPVAIVDVSSPELIKLAASVIMEITRRTDLSDDDRATLWEMRDVIGKSVNPLRAEYATA